MTNRAKTAIGIAALTAFAVLVAVVGIRGIWNAFVDFTICIESYGGCSWD